MSTRAATEQHAKAAKVAERKREAKEMEGAHGALMKRFGDQKKAIQARHERDVETRNKVTREDGSWEGR